MSDLLPPLAPVQVVLPGGTASPLVPAQKPAAEGTSAANTGDPFAALLSSVLESTQTSGAGATTAAPVTASDTEAVPADPATLPLLIPGLAQPLTDDPSRLTAEAIGNPPATAGRNLPPPAAAPPGAGPAAPAAPNPNLPSLADLEAVRGSLLAVVPSILPTEPMNSKAATAPSVSRAVELPEAPDVRVAPAATPSIVAAGGTGVGSGAAHGEARPELKQLLLSEGIAPEVSSGDAARGRLEFAGLALARAGSSETALPVTGATPRLDFATTAPGTAPSPPLLPLGDLSSFTTGMADRLLTLATPGTHEARLKLHPESLGALDVEITVEDGQAQVWFGTSSAQARDAIENSLPRLKELFAEQGITLTRTQVEHGGADARHQQANRQRQFGDEVPVTRPIRTPVPTSLVAPGLAGPSATRLLDVLA